MNSIERRLASMLSRRWWLLVLRGVAAIGFGVLTWVMPGLSLASLVLLFGAYSTADGIFALASAFAGGGDQDSRWALLLEGLLGIGVGVATFFAPAITAVALVYYIAIWAIATGVLEIVLAVRLRRELPGEWLLFLAGLASVVFGGVIVAHPGAGALSIIWLIGSYAVLFGVALLLLAFKLRRIVEGVIPR